MDVEKYGIQIHVPEPFLQKDLEELQVAIQEQDIKDAPLAVYHRKIVQAAEKCGWVLMPGPLKQQKPGMIRWAAQTIQEAVEAAQRLPKE